MNWRLRFVVLLSSFALLDGAFVTAATFPGNARVEINDTSGALSWSTNVNALMVSCWFKISVPSGTNLTQHMTILANGKTNDETTSHAYNIRFNINTGNIEFTTRGTSFYTNNLVVQPYQDRWYHVAVIRDHDSIAGYVDGRQVFSATPSPTLGSSATTNGVSIGGWGDGKYLYGEVQEVAVYQMAPSDPVSWITDYMFQDQPASSEPSLRGYYKLGPVDSYKNFAAPPPTGTDGAKAGNGNITFDQVDEAGEQSLFDSKRNGGENAITPLSGAFSWDQVAFARPTPGVAFEFRYGYSSANGAGGSKLGTADPYAGTAMGRDWRNTFDTRIIPAQTFSPLADVDTVGLMTWDGAIETWDLTNGVYRTRHKEYRGELRDTGSGFMEWTTPERVVYKFKQPNSGPALMRGRLVEIRDPSSNIVQLVWKETSGILTQVIDSVGGRYNFNDGSILTNVSFQGWNVCFQYDGNRLTNKFVTAPPAYANVTNRWSFTYDATSGLLNRIIDPRGNTNSLIYYDKYGRVTNTVDALGRATQTQYGVPDRRKITRIDPGNFPWIETYDRKGRVLSQADPLGNTTSYTYDDNGNRTSITEALGWKTFFSYDSRANVLSKTNALGQVTTWTYHSFFNKPLTETDPLNNTTTYTYNDTTGNLLSQFDNIGTLVSYSYTTNGLVKDSTDANGNKTTFNYNADGFLASKIDPSTNTTGYVRNEVGWVLAQTNALNQVTSFSYDVNGNVIQIVDPLFRTFTSVFDPNGNLIAQSDAKGQFTTNLYDSANQKTQMVNRVGSKWNYTYTSRGEINGITDPLGNVTSNAYDSANRLIKVFDPLGNTVQTDYDANGKPITVTDKVGQRWTKAYDRLSRVTRESDPFGDTKQTTYDAAGRIKTITTPNGYPSTHDYDARGRLTKWVDAEGFNWLYTYDGNGNIVDIEDALHGHYVMVYGNRNERVLEKNQDNFQWTYRYDKLLRPDQQTDPNGTVRTITYDAGSRILQVDFSTGRQDSHGYDDNNNLTFLSRSKPGNLTVNSTFAYDVMDRVTEYTDVSNFSKKIKYGYDALGRATSLTYPDNKVLAQSYDKLGRLTNQVDWASRQMKYTYDKANRLVSRTYPNGITQTNAFDNAGRLTDLQYKSPTNSVLMALTYAYDRNGNKIAETEQGTFDWPQPSMHNETAQYTPAGRLIDKVDSGVASNNWTYHYDPSGNMTNAVSSGGESFTLTYDEDNRVLSVFWDYPAMMDKVITNRYDALGRRISRKQDGVETRYALDLQGDMERILCDMNASGQITAYYIHGPDLCYKVDAANNLTCYHADAQANIIALTDGGATNVAQYAYTPYGRSLGSIYSASVTNQYLFVGSQGVMEDPPGSGLYFMRARYYSADTGTFLSTDPVKHIGPMWMPVAYAYAEGNPQKHSDPEGRIATHLAFFAGGFAYGVADEAIGEAVSYGGEALLTRTGIPTAEEAHNARRDAGMVNFGTELSRDATNPLLYEPTGHGLAFFAGKWFGKFVVKGALSSAATAAVPQPGYITRGTDPNFGRDRLVGSFQVDLSKETVDAYNHANNVKSENDKRQQQAQKWYQRAMDAKSDYDWAKGKAKKYWDKYYESVNKKKPNTSYRNAAQDYEKKAKEYWKQYKDDWKRYQSYK